MIALGGHARRGLARGRGGRAHPDVPDRNVILFCAFVVTVGTLLLQGTTLPWVIRKIGFEGDEERARTRWPRHRSSTAAAQAAVDRLDRPGQGRCPDHVATGCDRSPSTGATPRGNGSAGRRRRAPAAAYRRLRRIMLDAEREVFVKARDRGEIDDEVLFRVLRELDLEEAALSRE